jgi:Sulfotransferase domain
MERLGRYPLSVILSFLNEVGGTSLLITKKRFAYQLLPIFRLPSPRTMNDDEASLRIIVGDVDVDGTAGATVRPRRRLHQNRHCFVPCPVQDPPVLLARLNTRRLYQRRRRRLKSQKNAQQLVGLTTTEIAAHEWEETDPSQWFAPELELLRFLDHRNHHHELIRKSRTSTTTLLVSYPRSGNTLVRTLLERTTGLVTGSDTRPDRRLSMQLAQQHNLVGEGLSSPTCVALVKSHWPERIGNAIVHGHGAILVVRNPYDAIDSYWNMNATCSHTSTVTEQVYHQFQDLFRDLVMNEIDVWLKFHEYWIETVGHQQQVPILIVRFEDLINHTEYELARIVHFFLLAGRRLEKGEVTTASGQEDGQILLLLSDYWRNRIAHVISGHHHSIDKLGSYRPRSAANTSSIGSGAGAVGASSGGVAIGKSLQRKRYSPELLQYIHNRASDESVHPTNYLTMFGYDIFQQDFPANFAPGYNSSKNCSIESNKRNATTDANPTLTRSSNSSSSSSNTTKVHMPLRSDATTCAAQGGGGGGVCINVPGKQPAIRPIHCPFGRKLQTWRHSVTDNDRHPLPIEV